MKVFLVSFVFCILKVTLAEDAVSNLKNIQARPLHMPETQNNPVIVPVPVYTPVQQFPVQQHPPIQQYPTQQYPSIQQYPIQQYPQFVPVQPYPMPYFHHPVQHYPQMHQPHFYHQPQFQPQFSHLIPC